METMSSTTLEVAALCAASLARVATGAMQVSADRFGEVSIQGRSEAMPADLVETLGLAFKRSFESGRDAYAEYTGKGRGIYSDVDVRLVVVSHALVADCESVGE